MVLGVVLMMISSVVLLLPVLNILVAQNDEAREPQIVRILHPRYATYAKPVPAGPQAGNHQNGGGKPAIQW